MPEGLQEALVTLLRLLVKKPRDTCYLSPESGSLSLQTKWKHCTANMLKDGTMHSIYGHTSQAEWQVQVRASTNPSRETRAVFVGASTLVLLAPLAF